ncbi:MAG: MarR family transcriptional regulator [Chloroflexi bacterium]|nr:MarR family transcriptional regulator [Chloroflexota bacterium]
MDTASVDTVAHTLPHRLYRLLHDIYVLLDAADRNLLREFDLTPSQYTLLTLLEPGDGQRLIALSDRLLVARSTITRLIDQMEAAGLVQRINDPQDRRAQRVALTAAGQTLLRQAYAAHEQSLAERLNTLDEADRQALLVLLHKLRSGLRGHLGIPDTDL